MSTIERRTPNGKVTGTCDSRFSGILDAFVENFAARDELGASLCLTLEGKVVVDLWGGPKAPGGEPWDAQTVSIVYSSTNGRGLAGLYAPLANGGEAAGVRLVGADTLTRMSRVSVATRDDATLRIPTRFSLGFMKSMDNRALPNADDCSVLISESAFGHVGAGGSIGFADPECKMSFGYAMNRMGAGILLNDRGQSLIDAAYRALGYRSNASGAWSL